MLVVTPLAFSTVASGELARMRVFVAVEAATERELTKALLSGQLRRMTIGAGDRGVLSAQWERGVRVHRTAQRIRQAEPLNALMAFAAVVTELGVVHGRVAFDAARTLARSAGQPAIVAARAGDPRVAAKNAQARMRASPHVQGLPTVLAVTVAAGIAQAPTMRIFVTARASFEGNRSVLRGRAMTLCALHLLVFAL